MLSMVTIIRVVEFTGRSTGWLSILNIIWEVIRVVIRVVIWEVAQKVILTVSWEVS